MLKGIHPCVSPELLKVLAEMGHGDEIVFADAPYASLFTSMHDKAPKLRAVLIFDGEPLRGQHRLDSVASGMPSSPPDVDPARANPGTMIYTSGTTGVPKGAVRTSAGDPALTAQLLALIGYRSDDVYITTGPLYHSGPGGFMNIAQSLGNTVVLQHKFDAEDWCALVSRYRVTSTFSAPTPIRLITQLPDEVLRKYDLSSMRVMIANAAPWSTAPSNGGGRSARAWARAARDRARPSRRCRRRGTN